MTRAEFQDLKVGDRVHVRDIGGMISFTFCEVRAKGTDRAIVKPHSLNRTLDVCLARLVSAPLPTKVK